MGSGTRGTRWAAAAALVCVVTVLPGCGDDEPDDGGLPPASASASSGADDQDAVAASVTKYNDVVEAMQGEEPLDMAKLRSVATAGLAQKVGESIQVAKAEGLTVRHPSGGVRRSGTTVTVNGAEATLVECVDRRGTILVENGKAQPRDDTVFKPILTTYTVEKTDGEWKVAAAEDGAAC